MESIINFIDGFVIALIITILILGALVIIELNKKEN